ncbi:haloacid dehalogenase-like hydrolase [Sneathia sp. DSM 16631]|uniref:HAD family hydrolase n=1 Tax=Sneathia sp. DSM 16631 TaxID=2777994 RepID=UPI0018691C98|nr:HAD family hydrolase [Sneathia sp. DSM 16631]MBE3030655.1 haloacid dehalogenase-like hydrolase [Sneathia sp. DSM 16631]
MKKAIIYDFDKTIYSKETSMAFMFFFLKRHRYLIPKFILNLTIILFNIKDLKKVKNIFFSIFKGMDIENDINLFWEKEIKNIYPYFFEEIKENRKDADILILISASPDFLLEPIYKKLGFDILISTKYSNFTLIGKNCKKNEKLKRLNELGSFDVLCFYSDSLSDLPLFNIAKKKISINKGNKVLGLPKKNGWLDRWI